MPRHESTTTAENTEKAEDAALPVSEDETFYADQIAILLPAMMAHAGSIQEHSPASRQAFLAILERHGSMPQYGVYKEPQRPPQVRRRDSHELPEVAGAVTF